MPRTIIVRPEAEADIAAAFAWYEEQRAGLGTDFLDEIERCFQRIEDHPEAYSIAYRRYRRALTRRFPYKVFYVVEQDFVSIVAVIHAARHPQRWVSRLRSRQG
jgi:plasmid stabilization system protein ParE